MASPSLSPVSELCQITIARLPTTADADDDDEDEDEMMVGNKDGGDKTKHESMNSSQKMFKSKVCMPFLVL